MIVTKQMSLFDAPENAIIIHACNSQGMWGSGIAKPFAEKYPKSYDWYKGFCKELNAKRGTACGRAELMKFYDESHYVGYVITSHDYGPRKDSPEQIKVNTTIALQVLCERICGLFDQYSHPTVDVYSNKFNSGLFAVPWEDSELILKTVLKDFPRINWIVCSQ
jgi:ADP-ribose 1''-phosphate phosphatase